MSKHKKLFILVLVVLIAIFILWSAALDFSRLPTINLEYDIYPSALLKRINVILTALVAWSTGAAALNPRDSRRMKASFIFVCLGETAFLLGERMLGVGFFGVCQILLIIRNCTGFINALACAEKIQRKKLLLSSVTIIVMLFTIGLILRDMIFSSPSTIFVFMYGIILSISLWSAFACFTLKLLPVVNSKMVLAGTACFFCCDISVALDVILEPGLPWLLFNSLIWIFYIPALTLLALSCYSFN